MKSSPIIFYDSHFMNQSQGQCDCDCDCACAQVVTADSNGFLLSGDVLHKAQEIYWLPLDVEHTLAFNPLHGTPVVMNRAARNLWDSYVPNVAQDHNLDIIRLLVLSGLLQPEIQITKQSHKQIAQLSAWLHITDRCTLRCAYCYLPHLTEDMSADVGCKSIAAIFRTAVMHGYTSVKLKYAGGEPLLRLPQVLAWQKYAMELAKHHNITLEGVVLSNGTLLTPEYAAAIRAAGLRLMLSLDGLGQTHDNQRAFPDGRGSSGIVLQAVEQALTAGLIPDISITVTGGSIAGLPDLVAWVLDHNLPFSLNFYRADCYKTPPPTLQLETNSVINAMRAVYNVIQTRLPRRSVLSALVDRSNLTVPHRYPCNAGHSYLVFTPNGDIAKCQMNQTCIVANYTTSDPLEAIRHSSTGLHNPSVDEKASCVACMWRYRCAGGCPLQAWCVSGNYAAPSPDCAIYQALFPEALRLEGNRLLKYGVQIIPDFSKS